MFLGFLPPALCLRPAEEHASAKPLSGIELLMESHASIATIQAS